MIFNSVVIGAGVGLKHVEALNSHRNCKVISICEMDRSKHHYLKRKFPRIKIIQNFREIFRFKEKINLISIASYDSDHFNQLNSLSKICKNFIVEKPIVLSPLELKKLRIIVKKKRLKVFSNLVLREVRLFKKIKKEIDVKKIYNIEADYLWGRINKLYGWRSKIKNYSLTLGASIHMIDLINWLIDDLPLSIITKGNKIVKKNSEFKKNTFLTHLLTYKNNLIVKISANAPSVHPHFHEIKIFQKDKTFISNLTNQIMISKYQKRFKIKKLDFPYPDKENRKKLIWSFVNELLKERNNSLSFNYLCNLMQICFSADESLKKKKEIKINYF